MDKIARMDELDLLIIRAQAGDLDAFGTLVQRFQDMAVGYAYSILGDFHLAQDAAQEAFIEAYRNLGRVYGALVFPPGFAGSSSSTATGLRAGYISKQCDWSRPRRYARKRKTL